MVIMALDHVSFFWNQGRAGPEVALKGFPLTQYPNGWQQLTREITHLCAPGFQLLAGLGLAISVYRRERSGGRPWSISLDMLLRGAVLFFCEWVLLGVAVGGSAFFFIVLSCIGSAMAIFAVARFLPGSWIAAVSFLVLLTAPLYGPTTVQTPAASQFLINIWTHVALSQETTQWSVIYPIFPWIGFFGIGWWLGRGYAAGTPISGAKLVTGGLLLICAAIALRWFGGTYADRFPDGEAGPGSAGFWVLAKYPPSPVFSLLTLGGMLTMIGLLHPIDARTAPSRLARFVAVYGKTALFFYVIHFYFFASYPFATKTNSSYSLAVTYLVWLGGLAILWPLCLGYGKLRARYNRVLRYF
jgi:uncharacterized membrane protein